MAITRQDDYQPLSFYESHRPDGVEATGYFKFSHEGKEYFAYQVDGKIILISQGYKARAGRDNGIVSSRKNKAVEAQYAFHQHENRKWYFDILARNGQQVATSIWFDDETSARDHADLLLGKRDTLPTADVATVVAKAAPKTKDETPAVVAPVPDSVAPTQPPHIPAPAAPDPVPEPVIVDTPNPEPEPMEVVATPVEETAVAVPAPATETSEEPIVSPSLLGEDDVPASRRLPWWAWLVFIILLALILYALLSWSMGEPVVPAG